MRPKNYTQIIILLSFVFISLPSIQAEHTFNHSYSGKNVEKIAFPIGGIGSGNYFLEGNGSISGISVKHKLDFFNEPTFFAALCIKSTSSENNQAKVLEGPIPEYKIFSRSGNALGSGEKTYGLPRYANAEFTSAFPFCNIHLTDEEFPVPVEITGFSPFIPNEPDLSGLPVGAIEYKLQNPLSEPLEIIFSIHVRNFMGGNTFEKIPCGLNVVGPDGKFSIALQEHSANIHTDCCWYRGGWFDSLSLVWNNIRQGLIIDNPPDGNPSPGASLSFPTTLAPHESRTIRVLTAWYVPTSDISSIGGNTQNARPLSFNPARGTALAQQKVDNYSGNQLVNTYYPDGDAHVGHIISPVYSVQDKYLYFKVGGGAQNSVGVSIQEQLENGSFVTSETFHGKDKEQLQWVQFNLSKIQSSHYRIFIFDDSTEPWGHINVDSFVTSDLEENDFLTEVKKSPLSTNSSIKILTDFENEDYDNWQVLQTLESNPTNDDPVQSQYYVPWYVTQFDSVEEVLEFFENQYDLLRKRSYNFTQTLKKANISPEILEAVECNLAILKTPTILRQHDGRLWAWEGCQDFGGSCPGTCTHVWNYGQSIPNLFPSLERTFRQNEFNESLLPDGRQAFRGNIPIIPGGTAWDASDGQLGTIMRVHREWKISGSQDFLEEYWPKVILSLEHCIQLWDPNETGLLEKSHHNTYDINYTGPEGHCSSFYLGALTAVCIMGQALGQNVERYQSILEKGKKRYETELFNGEYFIQKIEEFGKDGDPDSQSIAYKEIAFKIDAQGPKYQYGTGCLSDGVLGFWIAKMCGINQEIIDPKLIHAHLLAVYKYNFKKNLLAHANPQRPTYALGDEGGLLLCSWPHNDRPLLPFPYSDEVWTGIEYQVASHLAFFGEYEKASDIVKACRNRYDGRKRNPFDEYECGHFYARATSSFGLIQGTTGVRYDAVSQTLYYRPLPHDYSVPIFTETGYGLLHYSANSQNVELEITEGQITVKASQAIN